MFRKSYSYQPVTRQAELQSKVTDVIYDNINTLDADLLLDKST